MAAKATSARTAGAPTATVERSGSLALYDPIVELWEQDGGNILFTYFRVPVGTSERAVEKEFLHTGRIWLDNMYKEGWNALERTVQCLGPVIEPDPENLDMNTYYIGCTFKRRYAQLITLDDEQVYRDTTPISQAPGRDFLKFLRRIAATGIDAMEKAMKGWDKKAEEERRLREEIDRLNARGGN